MKKEKRFKAWNPKIGERALVPGGPASAQYVDELNEHDIAAINDGHRGYTPLRVRIRNNNEKYQFSDLLWYDEKKGWWVSSSGGCVRTLTAALKLASLAYGMRGKYKIEVYAAGDGC